MKSVPIWFETFKVGEAEVAGDGTLSFSYSDPWLQARAAFALSVTMPRGKVAYPPKTFTPWLANLLPEGQQMERLASLLRCSQADSLGILERIGGDTAGALSFGVPADPSQWAYVPLTKFYETSDQRDAMELHLKDIARRPFLAGEQGVRLSLAGFQEKSALTVLDQNDSPVLRLPQGGDRLAIPLHGAPSTLIVKPDNPRLPGITENEVWCQRMARAMGIEAAQATVLRSSERIATAVLRYDRHLSQDNELQRLHQEDFAQANGLFPSQKYERGDARGLGLKGLMATATHLDATGARALLDHLVFNILVANSDAHAKNYSLLMAVAERPSLAPLYDVQSVLPWPDEITQDLALDIAGETLTSQAIEGRHWDAMAAECGLRPAEVRGRVIELAERLVKMSSGVTEDVADMPGARKEHARQVADLVEANASGIVTRL